MKKGVMRQSLEFIGLLLLFCLFWTIVFGEFIPVPVESDEIAEPFQGAIMISGFLTTISLLSIARYNKVRRLEQKIHTAQSNITIIEKRNKSLLDKVNRLVDKYQMTEKDTLLAVSQSTSKVVHSTDTTSLKGSKVETSEEFGRMLKDMPEIAANRNVEKLLDELIATEHNLAQFCLFYNEQVEEFNGDIKMFPLSLIAKWVGLTPKDYYAIHTVKEGWDLSDEALGL